MTALESLALYGIDAEVDDVKKFSCLKNLKHLRINIQEDIGAIFKTWVQEETPENPFISNLKSFGLFEYMHSPPGFKTAFPAFLKKATNLRRLDISEVPITAPILKAIASSCPQLRKLYLGQRYRRFKFTPEMQEIVDKCPQLKWVDCRHLDPRDLKVEKYRKIKFERYNRWTRPFEEFEY